MIHNLLVYHTDYTLYVSPYIVCSNALIFLPVGLVKNVLSISHILPLGMVSVRFPTFLSPGYHYMGWSIHQSQTLTILELLRKLVAFGFQSNGMLSHPISFGFCPNRCHQRVIGPRSSLLLVHPTSGTAFGLVRFPVPYLGWSDPS